MTMVGGGRYDVPIDFIGGSLEAKASVYVGQPLDTLKVKMETFPKLANLFQADTC